MSLDSRRALYEHIGLRRIPDEYLVGRRCEQSLRLQPRPDTLGGELPGRELHATILARWRTRRTRCVLKQIKKKKKKKKKHVK